MDLIKVKKEVKKKSAFVSYVQNRVLKRNKNFIMVVVGATGSGKSYACMKLGEALDSTFNIDRVCFKTLEFINLVKTLTKSNDKENYRGKVILWDELGVEQNSREFMSLSNRVINYFFQTSRHLNLIVLMTVPLITFVDISTRQLAHAMGEMGGINFSNNSSKMITKFNQTNVMTAKTYKKFLRVYEDGKWKVVRHLVLGLPSKKLLKAYEIKKKKYTSSLYSDIIERLEEKDKPKNEKKPLTELQKRILEIWEGGETRLTEISKIIGIRHPTQIGRNVRYLRNKGYEMEKKEIVKKKKTFGNVLFGGGKNVIKPNKTLEEEKNFLEKKS